MKKSSNYVQSVIRALDIIELLNEKKELGVTQIGEALDLDKSTVHRLLNTLKFKGYVQQNPVTQKYSNSYKLFEMGTIEIDRLGLIRRANPYMERIAAQTRETVNLAILDGARAMYVEKIESTEVIKADIGVGRSYPAYATSLGKVMLAYSPREKVIRLFGEKDFSKFTPNTLGSLDELLAELKIIRRRGYALDDEEFIPGLACIAAPVRAASGDAVAALSISYPRYRYKSGGQEEKTMQEMLLKTARELSSEFGFEGP
jgi:DNA-binding IclR family transcriptional regulator